MDENSNYVFQNLGTLFHEVRQSFYYMFSAYSILDGKVPETAAGLLDEIGKICQKFRTEIDDFPANIDPQSAVTASVQIRSSAIRWEKDTEYLSRLINEIKILNIQLEDPSVNKFLNETLSYSLQKFIQIISYSKEIQAEDLTTKPF